jgi:threonine dehydratase
MRQAIAPDDIRAAHQAIQTDIRRTPVVEIDRTEFGLARGPLSFKLELLQHSGSFKARGAFTNLRLREIPSSGVVAASGGNHGVAVAYAARQLGVAAKIFVPSVIGKAKLERLREYGAHVEIAGDRYDDALAASAEWRLRSGAMDVHAFEQRETLLGQGTLGLELAAQLPSAETLLVAVGGGGLIGGIAAWYRGNVKIVGVEPFASPTLFKAMQAGRPVDAEAGGIAADSLAPRRVGELMFPLAQQYVDRVALVTDAAIQDAQAALWNGMRIAAEPGGAAAFAALLSGAYMPAPGEHVCVIVCGGNIAWQGS